MTPETEFLWVTVPAEERDRFDELLEEVGVLATDAAARAAGSVA